MKLLSELIKLEVAPEEKQRKKPQVETLLTRLRCSDSAKLSRRYECEVFNFLFENKAALGIQEVSLFKNLRVDGGVLLVDGRRFAVEIKLRMNWTKALQAGYEFKRFLQILQTDEALTYPVKGAIVFFEEFQGDGWHRRPKCRLLENGWNEWYRTLSKHEEYRLHLLRFRHNQVGDYHSEKRTAEMTVAFESMTEDEQGTILGQMEKRDGTV